MTIRVQIEKDFGGFNLNVDFHSDSRRIGILGASGCGKSMTLKGIAGIQEIDRGYIEVNEKVFMDTKNRIHVKPQKRRVGYLFQNYALFPTMTVQKNIMAGLGALPEKKERTAEMIKKFRLEGLENHLPEQLSGGQQQRVALARIMAYQPEVVLLDEPYSALDEFLKDRLQQEMIELLNEYQGIVILVSHNRDEIYRFSEELLIMENGTILCCGGTKELFRDPKRNEAARLTGCKNIVPAKRLDEHTFEIQEWGIIVHSLKALPSEFDHIGYRAHDFVPVWGQKKKNCFPFSVNSIAQLPFEQKYYLASQGEEICWFVQRSLMREIKNRGLPDFLELDTEKILYLRGATH